MELFSRGFSQRQAICLHVSKLVRDFARHGSTNQIRNETSTTDSLDSHLCGLGLLLVVNDRDVRDVDLHKVVLAGSDAQLSEGLDEGHRLDIANGTSKLDNANIRLLTSIVDWDLSDSLDPILDRLDNVWNDLYSMSKVITASFFEDDMLIDLSSRNVVVAGQCDVEVALVVSKIQIDFSTVIEDKAFTVPVES